MLRRPRQSHAFPSPPCSPFLRSCGVPGPWGAGGPGGGSLAEVVAGLSEEGLFDALVLTGGETAVGVARRLGAAGIRLEGEVEPGIPAGSLLGPAPYPVVTKAGGFGEPDTLVRVVRELFGEGKDRGQWTRRS